MAALLERGAHLLREVAARFRARRENWPIADLHELARFARTRAAFVAQKKLYGYLKTRIGTRYPSMFEDQVFVDSINVAKMHVFAACLSDLTVHAVAKATAGSEIERDRRADAALACYRAGLDENAEHAQPDDVRQWLEAFQARLADINWENVAAGGDAFSTSPKALVRWAPIADEHKRYDAQIVRNSVRYAWNEVIRDLRLRLDAAAIQQELRAR